MAGVDTDVFPGKFFKELSAKPECSVNLYFEEIEILCTIGA
jgi:hypothetical protein